LLLSRLNRETTLSNRKIREDEPIGEVQPDEPYVGIGEQLRERRLRAGGDLQQIAGTLRIRFAYLKAIEEGRFDLLPGTTYANGFVRSYANHLGFDGEAAVASFRTEAALNIEENKLVFPAPIGEAKVPTGRILLLSLVLAGAVYSGWFYFMRAPAPMADMAPPPLSAIEPVAAQPVAPPQSPTADTASVQGAPAPEATPASPAVPAVGLPAASPAAVPSSSPEVPVTTPALSEAAPPPVEAPPAVASVPVPPPQPTTAEGAAIYGETSGVSRISVKAIAFSWIQIRDPKGGAIFTRTLRKGEVYRVPLRDDLMLIAGNAGGVEISVDGKVIGRLGEKSQVRRDIRLSASRLLEKGIAPPPEPAPVPPSPAPDAPRSEPAAPGGVPN
jgi:cytoskeleton protein RodZ